MKARLKMDEHMEKGTMKINIEHIQVNGERIKDQVLVKNNLKRKEKNMLECF